MCSAVKFVFSYVLRKKLEDFSQEFDKLVRDMDSIYKSTMQIQMATVVTNTTEILRRLSFEDPDARHLKHLVPLKEGDDATLRVMVTPNTEDDANAWPRITKITSKRSQPR